MLLIAPRSLPSGLVSLVASTHTGTAARVDISCRVIVTGDIAGEGRGVARVLVDDNIFAPRLAVNIKKFFCNSHLFVTLCSGMAILLK